MEILSDEYTVVCIILNYMSIMTEIVQGVANQNEVFCILEKTGISNFLLLRGFSKLEKFQNTNMKIDKLFEHW